MHSPKGGKKERKLGEGKGESRQEFGELDNKISKLFPLKWVRRVTNLNAKQEGSEVTQISHTA